MAKSAFQAKLSSIMEIVTESAMKQICEIVDSDFAYLRLELTRALNENAALSDKMHAMENEVEVLRNAKTESPSRCKYRSVCIQTLEVSDSPSINEIFGKEWCSSLWDGKDPRTEEKAGDAGPRVSDEHNNKLLSIKEENCEKEICPSNTMVTKKKNPSSPSKHNDIPEVNLDDDDDNDEDDQDIYLIRGGFVETPEVLTIPSATPETESPKIIPMDSTIEHFIESHYDRMEFDEHCVPIEFVAGEHTERQPFEEQGKLGQENPVTDAAKSLANGQTCSSFDRFSERPESEDKIKTTLHCSDCSKAFVRQSDLTLHKKECHQKENTDKCKMCKVIFPQKNLLRTHRCPAANKLVKSSNQRFRCEQCEKHFHSKSNLNVHYAVHTGERPHMCDYCGKGFSQKGNLKTHERIHKGERPFICVTCGKGFTQKVNLKQHLVVHSRIKKSKSKKKKKRRQVPETASSMKQSHSADVISRKKH